MKDVIEIGDHVVCINDIGQEKDLNEGNIYEVIDVISYGDNEHQFRVFNDCGVTGTYYIERFKLDRSMCRNKRIEEILN